MSFIATLKEFEEHLDLSAVKDLSIKDRETLYAAAYGMYEAGDYEKGANLFTRLVLHDPYEIRFWKGLASCRQMQHAFQEALHAWSIVCLLSGHQPIAHFHAAECYLSLGEMEEALKALNCAQFYLKSGSPLSEKIDHLKEQLDHG